MKSNNAKFWGSMGGGFFNDLMLKIRLTIKLVQDDRIDMLVRAIPVLCLIYLIVPIDLLIGPIDDAMVIYFGMDFFISLCPREIVDAYLSELQGAGKVEPPEEPIIDAEFKDKE
jgi:uncharacterized membrane protein YkvA (DUF1232 family)